MNSVNIHHVIEGRGKPVVLMHGWPEFWYGWRKQIPVLSQHFQTVVPDMRGFGYSDKPLSGYDTRTVSSDIYKLVRSLDLQQVDIVAHYIGVPVAYRFTLDHEDTGRRLVLLDSTPPMEQLGHQPTAVVRQRWHSYFHQQFDLPEKLIEGREEIYLHHILRDWTINKYPLTSDEIAEYVQAYSQPGALRDGFNYYRAAGYEDPPHWQSDARRELSHQVLFLYGARRIKTAVAQGTGPLENAWRGAFPNVSGKDMGNYRHFLQRGTPESTNREIIDSLS